MSGLTALPAPHRELETFRPLEDTQPPPAEAAPGEAASGKAARFGPSGESKEGPLAC